ncbi:MAG: hypothetical protein H6551_04130 [Chitinophagales bacterium]|nr:hypothetical protein [Chitinophagaceae bacterium]MCB9064311.1 hypothetical protein [Chitinophagales bacterium]
MSRIYISGLLLMVMFSFSCKQNTLTLTPDPTKDTSSFTYDITGLRDTSLERTGEVRYVIFVERKTGKADNVVLSAHDMPAGMEVSFDPISADTASFYTTVVVRNTRVTEGEYKINIKGASPKGGIKLRYVNVKVLPYSNNATGLVGYFTETGTCSQSGSVNNEVNVELDETGPNKLIIKGLLSGVWTNDVKATIDPANKTINIPKQVQNSVTFEGDGTYDDDKIVINYTVKGATINESCTSTLTRKP